MSVFFEPRFTFACLAITSLLGCTAADTPTAEDAGPTDELSATLEEVLPPLQSAYYVPGVAVGVIEGGEVVLARGFGFADLETEHPVDSGTAFNIGSISKTVASWGVMKLVEDGEIDLDAPVGNYLTRWQLPESEYDHDKITMRRLLSHTAGLSLHGYPGFSPDDELPTVEESLSGATNGPDGVYVIHEPGSKWQYSGGGYTLAQLIVEEVTGLPFAEYMDKEVLDPLGMRSSNYVWDEQIDSIAATPYNDAGEPIPGPRFTAMAAASLQTTTDDFLRFAIASTGGDNPVLDRETIASMQRPVAPADDYGMGYDINQRAGKTLVGHGGSNDGWMARLTVVPETGDGLVVMTNGSNGGLILQAVVCHWRAAALGDACTESPELPIEVSTSVLERAVGRYQVPDDMLLDLRVDEGRLFVYLPNGFRALALPRSETEFFLAAGPVSFELELDETGKSTALAFRQGNQPERRAARVE